MPFLELLRRHLLWTAISTGAVIGAVIGLFLPIRAAAPPTAAEAPWVLPEAQAIKRYDEARYLSLRGAKFWGELASPGRRGPQTASWDLTAIVTRPGLQVAVSGGGPSKSKWVRVGGELPDGSVLVAANRDTVWYEKDGCRRARSLYASAKPEADACIGAPQPPAAAAADASAPAPPPARATAPAVRRTN